MARSINRLVSKFLICQPPGPVYCSLRLASRWTHRSPAKVLLPFQEKPNLKKEKVIDLDASILNKAQAKEENVIGQHETGEEKTGSSVSPEKTKQIKQKRDEKLKKRNFYLSQQKVFDDAGDILFEKLKENDGRLRYVYLTILVIFISPSFLFSNVYLLFF